MHAKYNSLSEATRSLSQGPRQNVQLPATKTDQQPDLMSRLHTTTMSRHGLVIHDQVIVVNHHYGLERAYLSSHRPAHSPAGPDEARPAEPRSAHAVSPAPPTSAETAPAQTPRARARRRPSRRPRPTAPRRRPG